VEAGVVYQDIYMPESCQGALDEPLHVLRPADVARHQQALAAQGFHLLLAGPGGVLAGLVRRTLPGALVLAVDGTDNLEELAKWWT